VSPAAAAARWGFVGDDLTGTQVVGGKFAAHGLAVRMLVEWRQDCSPLVMEWPHGTILGVNADSRVRPRSVARRRLRAASAWLRHQGCTHLFKFVDSSLRGHVGPELDAARAAMGSAWAVVIPGAPQVNRTIENGILLVGGRPVELTEVARDPLSPVRTSRVDEIFGAGSAARYAVLPPPGDSKPTRSMVARTLAGGRIPVFDVPDFDSVRRAVDALWPWLIRPHPRFRVVCGSVGLAQALAERLGGSSAPEAVPTKAGTEADVLVVSGSATEATATQIRRVEQEGIPILLVPDLAIEGAAGIDGAVRRIEACLEASGAAVVSTALGEAHLEGARRRASRLGLDPGQVLRESPEALGRLVRRLVDQRRAARRFTLVLVGGMTAMAALTALEVDQLRPLGEEDLVVRALVIGGPLDGDLVLTKGGAAGGEDVLVDTLRSLGRLPQVRRITPP
jgi:uncharacterized protein YgbK (DUF1537 family)